MHERPALGTLAEAPPSERCSGADGALYPGRRSMSGPVYEEERLGMFAGAATADRQGWPFPAPLRPAASQAMFLDACHDAVVGRADNGAPGGGLGNESLGSGFRAQGLGCEADPNGVGHRSLVSDACKPLLGPTDPDVVKGVLVWVCQSDGACTDCCWASARCGDDGAAGGRPQARIWCGGGGCLCRGVPPSISDGLPHQGAEPAAPVLPEVVKPHLRPCSFSENHWQPQANPLWTGIIAPVEASVAVCSVHSRGRHVWCLVHATQA